MANAFCDREGILLTDWLPEKTTINSDYYITVLEELRTAIGVSEVILQHDDARHDVSALNTNAIKTYEFRTLPHPAYRPELAPSDYWLFEE